MIHDYFPNRQIFKNSASREQRNCLVCGPSPACASEREGQRKIRKKKKKSGGGGEKKERNEE